MHAHPQHWTSGDDAPGTTHEDYCHHQCPRDTAEQYDQPGSQAHHTTDQPQPTCTHAHPGQAHAASSHANQMATPHDD